MEQKYFSLRNPSGTIKSIRRALLLSVLGLIGTQAGAQQTYTFTNCGATGRFGPTQTQVNATYGGGPLSGQVTISGQGIQEWTIPGSGTYKILAVGASGGSASSYNQFGLGASMEGIFTLTGGQILKIIVGQEGGTSTAGGAGGGGSFVVDQNNTPLVVAGGGSGGGNYANPVAAIMDGRTTNYGANYQSTGRATAGGGGGSFAVSGLNANGGSSFLAGGAGGDLGGGNGGFGGFGGGGGSSGSNALAAGGGGYSGGDEMYGYQPYQGQEGGGGSYNSGTNQVNASGVNTGHGRVIITRLCDVNVSANSNPICIGDQVVLSTNAGSGINWSTGASTQSITVSPTTNTSYTVSGVSSSTSACINTLVITVSVNPLPVIAATGVPSVVCAGSTATLNAYGAGTYTWSNSLNGWTTTVAPPATSVYTVTGTDGNGCVNHGTVEVTVNTNSLDVTPPVTICSGSSQSLTASGGASSTSYTWFPQANFPTIIVSPTVTTTYVVAATDMHNCMITNSVEVTVVDKPSIIASVDRDQICRGESVTLSASGGDNYTWSNGVTGQSNNVKLTADVTYTFAVTGTDPNGCVGTGTTAVVVNKCTGVDESSALSRMSISPNPSAGIFQLTFQEKASRNIRVTDLTGKVVYEKQSDNAETVLDLSGYPGGVYSVQVISASSATTHKLIKD